MIVVLGPTASGKTALAARLAFECDGEVISADSRQVYRGMDIGTGKDRDEYNVNGKVIPVHLIDIADPGFEYNIFEYQRDFLAAYRDITGRGKIPVMCGGSGMYIESILKGYQLRKVAEDKDHRQMLEMKSDDELREIFFTMRVPHNTTDLVDRNRIIRAIEIAAAGQSGSQELLPDFHPVIFGVRYDREVLKSRITARLKSRLQNGMIEEVKGLLEKGMTAEQLKFYGLEYRYITLYLENEMDYNEMFCLLNIAIHQFGKRQMTWFRRMEKNGIPIHWIDGELEMEEKLRQIIPGIKNQVDFVG